MKLYDLTLKKALIEKEFWEEVRKIPRMTFEEVEALNVKINFIMKVLSKLEEI